MMIDFKDAVWAEASRTKAKNTVSEKVDVYITETTNSGNGNPKKYLVIRMYAKKFKEVFGDCEKLSVGFLGNYVLLKKGEGYRVYPCSNPEIRVPFEVIEDCGRKAGKMYGGYLLKVDEAAGIAYIDLSIGARA